VVLLGTGIYFLKLILIFCRISNWPSTFKLDYFQVGQFLVSGKTLMIILD
jgi:hypothetical protein